MKGALLALALLAAGCGTYTPSGSDRSYPRLRIPPYQVDLPMLDLDGTTAPGREVELYVNGHPRSTATGDAQGAFRFERIALHPGLNILRAVLLPTEEEVREGAETPLEEYRYEPPPYAEVRVAFVRQAQR